MNGEFNQAHEDYLERQIERRERREMADPVFLDDPNPGESISVQLALLVIAVAFCLLLYAVMAIPE